ncbi:hypothetical protein HYH02_005074 [Chlamydomonas schloesseri]|uniref:Uncharacterized protein n=1 Tax=Chlamydomonas schloesseri TaxID=2026947 RepID=A0A835WNP7_9CHLO|nr:hypothetical protein HYH02_005074 [Chlamydomonas schloesseri]|eukprot:KAG2450573.1 hypothetical protein HYH02_005074 [Chlamydomonas schloesseri]
MPPPTRSGSQRGRQSCPRHRPAAVAAATASAAAARSSCSLAVPARAAGAMAALLLALLVLLGTCGLGHAAPPAGPATAAAAGAGASKDDARCRGALKLQTDPSVQAFKQCANKTPIPMDCCLKMIPFAPYADCLQLPQYKSLADSFLAPTVTVDRALRECLG